MDSIFLCFNYSLYSDDLLQVNLRSIGRKRYAHLSEEDQDEIHVVETVPWGEDTLFTLEFREGVNKYAIHTCNNQYLQKDGKLTPTINNVRNECFGGVHLSLQAADLGRSTLSDSLYATITITDLQR